MANDADSLLMQGEKALRALDKVLRDEPKKVGPDFSEAITQLSALRDTMIARYRYTDTNAGDSLELHQLNAVLTVVISGHYPLGKVPWPHIEKARESFALLLGELGKVPPGRSEREEGLGSRAQ